MRSETNNGLDEIDYLCCKELQVNPLDVLLSFYCLLRNDTDFSQKCIPVHGPRRFYITDGI